MDQFDLNKSKSTFSSLIEGKKTGEEEYEALTALLDSFPYCQPLHMIKAAAERSNPERFTRQLSKAALYTPDRSVLYKFVNEPELFFREPVISDEIGFAEEISEILPYQQEQGEVAKRTAPEPAEEILVTEDKDLEPTEAEVAPEVEVIETEEEPEEQSGEAKATDEPPFFDNIASSDYFTFNKSTADPLSKHQEDPELKPSPSDAEHEANISAAIETTARQTTENISKYHDEELPYTFLWWLHKTRKEHAHTYQPYATLRPQASEALKNASVDELNHQIIENIFHLQVPLEDEKTAHSSVNTIEFALQRQGKKEYLIEKFIKEEPQIRPPKAEKIDTENKARKSSEDNLELVSETLAQIYIEQMLYHKAIETYKKLSLKFPEKSAYFADQINDIQKKIS